MIPIKQTRTDNNCLATCIASLLEIDINIVPNFGMMGRHEWWFACVDFIQSLGYEYGGMAQLHNLGDEQGIDGYIIAFGKSPRGEHSHAVIYKEGIMVHDPHPDNTGIVGEPQDFFIINRVTPTAAAEEDQCRRNACIVANGTQSQSHATVNNLRPCVHRPYAGATGRTIRHASTG